MGTLLKTLKTYGRHAWSHTRKPRITLLVTAMTASFALIVTPIATAQSNTQAAPEVLASVGDSISNRPLRSQSWTTGTSTTVNSIHNRLEAASGQDVRTVREAVRGADSEDLAAQMSDAIESEADLVTVLMGANDVCADTVEDMTPVETFQQRYGQALQMADSAGIKVVAVSIPSLNQLWAVAKDSETARLIWDAVDLCQTALANPLSEAPEDTARRALVQQRTEAYNAAIIAECDKYQSCADDNGAVYATQLTLSDISRDYFHPNAQGSAKIAAAVWPAVESLYPNLEDAQLDEQPTPPPAEPTTPVSSDNSSTKTVTLKSPIRIHIKISKVEVTIDGKTYTGNVEDQGNGTYVVVINTDGQAAMRSSNSTVKIKAYNNESKVIYQGSMAMKSS